MSQTSRVCVLGAGSYGTALAAHLARNKIATTLWGRDAGAVVQMQQVAQNQRYLPDVVLPENLHYSADLPAAVAAAEVILLATPSSAFERTLEKIKPLLSNASGIVWACKGLHAGSGKFLSEVATSVLGEAVPQAVISGPTFARELALGLPTALTVASADTTYCQRVCELLHSPRFRAYASDDLHGVQLGGALKNVYAIAAGISDGLHYGANSRVALITRGLAEMRRLGDCLGAQAETLSGLSGTGDLILTCTDNQSRNRRFGLALAGGATVAQAFEDIGQAVEGASATLAAQRLASQYGVDMPIVQQVYRVVQGECTVEQAGHALLQRAPRSESA